jgi:Bacterial SH3 domain
MKRLLLSLWVGGAALYTANTFIFVHSVNLTGHPKIVSASAGQPASDSASQSTSTIWPPSGWPAVGPDNGQSVCPSSETRQIAKTSAPSPGTEEKGESSAPPISESENEEPIWVEGSLAARVHAGPSVSAPSLRFYPLGTELHLIGHEQGWFQIADPTTSEPGWIYEKYLEAIRAPGQRQELSHPIQSTRVAFETPASRQPLARAKKQQQDAERAQPPVRSESVASLVERAFSGY